MEGANYTNDVTADFLLFGTPSQCYTHTVRPATVNEATKSSRNAITPALFTTIFPTVLV